MSNVFMKVRPSGVLKYDDCPRAYKYQYVDRIRTETTSVNLPFGTAVHDACTSWLIADSTGKTVSIADIFREGFQKALDTKIVSFPQDKLPEDLFKMGEALVTSFPAAWTDSGLKVLMDKDGMPMVERRLETEIRPGVVLSGQPDVVAVDAQDRVVVPDIKTPAQSSDEVFAAASEQLTSYQLLLEDPNVVAFTGRKKVDRVGFFEGIKRKVSRTGKGPTWEPPILVDARSDSDIDDLKMKIQAMAADVEAGVFPKRPRMAFNSPCTMCDYVGLCHRGDKSGLIFSTSDSDNGMDELMAAADAL